MQAAFDTTSVTVRKPLVAAIASALVHESCWFEVTPLPFDNFEVAVKVDRGTDLRRITREVRAKD